MNDANFDIYLSKLQDFILNENKIVTLKWLTKQLNIDINLAKKLLENYVKDNEELKKENILVTYLISGLKGDNACICLISDSKLNEIKNIKLLTKQIFSVQKGHSQNFDLNLLHAVDKEIIDCPGYIELEGDIKRKVKTRPKIEISEQTIKNEKSVKKILEKPSEKKTSNINSLFQKQQKIDKKDNDNSETNDKSKIQNGIKTESVPKKTVTKPKGIASFFTKQIENAKSKKIEDDKKIIETEKKSQNPISNLFQNGKVVKNETNKIEKLQSEIIALKEKNKVSPKKSEKETKTSNDSIKKSNKKSSKRNRNEDTSSGNKKRRRIVVDSDSSDDDIFEKSQSPELLELKNGESDDEDIIPNTPQPQSQKIANTILNKTTKRRKIVEKTFLDDEGFMVTRKEEVYQTDSDEELTEDRKKVQVKEKNKSVEKKVSPAPLKNSPKKQATLSSFFKRK